MAIKTLKKLLIIFCFSLNIYIYGQDSSNNLPQNYLYSSFTGLNADSNIFNDISLNSFELLSTNIQFSKSDDLQKVVFAPFKLINLEKYRNKKLSFLYNTKLNFAQKNKISTIGIGFTWDNSAHFSERGRKIARKLIAPAAAEVNKKVNKIYADKLKLDIKNAKEGKLIYSLSEKMISDLENILAFLKTKPETAFIPLKGKADFNEPDYSITDYLYYIELYKAYTKKSQEILDTDLALKYFKALQNNSVKITFGGNISLFDIVGGDDVDIDNNGLIDNKYSAKQKNISLGITHIVSETFGYSLTGYLLEKREGTEEGNLFINYSGLSAAFGYRTWVLNKDYEKTEEYKKSLFVPSIHTGVSFEYLKCNEKDNSKCVDGISSNSSFTPYVEFKISPKNQFKLGIPFSKTNQLDSETNNIGPFLQWRLQLSGKN